jgi:hypothetical protein
MRRLLVAFLAVVLTAGSAPPARAATDLSLVDLTNPDQWVYAVLKQLEGDLADAVGVQLEGDTASPEDPGFFGFIGELAGIGHGEFTLDTRITPGLGTIISCQSVVCFQNSYDLESVAGSQYLFLTDTAEELLSIQTTERSLSVVDAGPTLRSLAVDTISAALSVVITYVLSKVGFTGTACRASLKEMGLSIAYELIWRVVSAVQLIVGGDINAGVTKFLDSIVALPEIMIRNASTTISVCAVDMGENRSGLEQRFFKQAVTLLADPFLYFDIGASVTKWALGASNAIANLNKTERVSISFAGPTPSSVVTPSADPSQSPATPSGIANSEATWFSELDSAAYAQVGTCSALVFMDSGNYYASTQSLQYSSTDPKIAEASVSRVPSGDTSRLPQGSRGAVICGVKAGDTQITAKSKDGTWKHTWRVKVGPDPWTDSVKKLDGLYDKAASGSVPPYYSGLQELTGCIDGCALGNPRKLSPDSCRALDLPVNDAGWDISVQNIPPGALPQDLPIDPARITAPFVGFSGTFAHPAPTQAYVEGWRIDKVTTSPGFCVRNQEMSGFRAVISKPGSSVYYYYDFVVMGQ